jgi:acyl-CoA synthetase (AMP-forming)/AMP-acid ligase II
MNHAQVREAVILVREDDGAAKRLVAYYIAREGAGEELDAESLRTHLKSVLPEYMVPAAYVRLMHWPLTPNGKLDRRALPAPDASALVLQHYEAPEGELETQLAQL